MRIAVASRSFSNNAQLMAELSERYRDVTATESPKVIGGAELIALLRGRDAAIVGLERIDDEVLQAVPELRIISKYGVGLDGLDIDAIAKRGIKLGWEGGVNRRSVSELTLAFAISLLHRVPEATVTMREGQFLKLIGHQLTNRTVGIIGCGFVGQDLVRLLAPFDCRVLAHDISDYAEFYRAHQVTPVSLDTLLAESDIVTLHVPLDKSTKDMIGAKQLGMMRKGSILINNARGGLVDEDALADALASGHLAGAACDVFTIEPDANPRLLAQPTFFGTPHIGGSTKEAQLAMGRAAIEGLEKNRVPGDGWPIGL